LGGGTKGIKHAREAWSLAPVIAHLTRSWSQRVKCFVAQQLLFCPPAEQLRRYESFDGSFGLQHDVIPRSTSAMRRKCFLSPGSRCFARIASAAAQHRVHPTSGSLRVFKLFAQLEVVSDTIALSRPTHSRVTQTVGRPTNKMQSS